MKYDMFEREREAATVLPNGCKTYLKECGYKPGYIGYFWRPKALNPTLNMAFKTPEAAQAMFDRYALGHDAHQKRIAEQRAARKPSAETLAMADPGAIFSYLWGYDQSNIEYFQVVKRSGSLVTVARIGAELVESHGSNDQLRPAPNAFIMKCGHPAKKWDGSADVCGQSERCEVHYSESRAAVYGGSYHEYQPILDTQVKKVGVNGQNEPYLSFDHGGGRLVKQITFKNAPPLIVGTDYATASGYGH